MTAAKQSSERRVVPLFRATEEEVVPDVRFGARPRAPESRDAAPVARVDLSGKPKLWCLLGAGNTGKTVEARWLFERMAGQERSALLGALDPTARSLSAWFEDVEQPGEGENAGRWLRRTFEGLMASGATTAILDFGGGGEAALRYCVDAVPDLHGHIEAAELGLVACYCLTARVDDLAILDRLSDAGFRPKATVLLMSPGPESPRYHIQYSAFSAVTRHGVFREAERRGAMPIWIPPLEADVMREIERKRLPFGMAAGGQVPEGATFAPIGVLRRPMVARWLERMEGAHKPISTWLP